MKKNQEEMKMSHFEKKETYLHFYAIKVLERWINEYPNRFNLKPIRITKEEKFCTSGFLDFIPDLCVYEENGITTMFEVAYKNDLNAWKLMKMQLYFWNNKIDVNVFEISAEYIIKQLGCPYKPKMIKMITLY